MKLQYGLSLYLLNGQHALEHTHTRSPTLSLGHFPSPPPAFFSPPFRIWSDLFPDMQTPGCRTQVHNPSWSLCPTPDAHQHETPTTCDFLPGKATSPPIASGIWHLPCLPLLWNLDFSASAIAHQRTDGDIDGATWPSVKLLESDG